MALFTTSPWTNGKPNHLTGSGFGISIPRKIRENIFQKHWETVVLNIDGVDFQIKITSAFWANCNELRSKGIGEWLIKNKSNKWPFGLPPSISVVYEGENRFSLLSVKQSTQLLT